MSLKLMTIGDDCAGVMQLKIHLLMVSFSSKIVFLFVLVLQIVVHFSA